MYKSSFVPLIGVFVLACSAETGDNPSTTGGTSGPTSSGTDSASTGGPGSDPTAGSSDSTTDSASGTAPTATAGTTMTDGGGTGGAFLGQPDLGSGGEAACDIWAQDCPAGQKCMPYANDGSTTWNDNKCTPVVPNPKQLGDPCTVEGAPVSGVDDCDLGLMCYGVDESTGQGRCLGLCKGDPQSPVCDDANAVCSIENDGTLPVCFPPCDPLLQNCPPGNVCLGGASGEDFACVVDNSGAGGVAGDPCEMLNACDPGLYCQYADLLPGCSGSAGCCGEFCDLTLPDSQCACASGGCTCLPWFPGTPTPGYEDVGFCALGRP